MSTLFRKDIREIWWMISSYFHILVLLCVRLRVPKNSLRLPLRTLRLSGENLSNPQPPESRVRRGDAENLHSFISYHLELR